MKKWFLLVMVLGFVSLGWSQQKQFTSRVFDGITYQPLAGASVYNMNTQKFAFTDKDGRFTMRVSLHDTLVISKSIYRQLVVEVNKTIFYGAEDFFLYYKATMLKEVRIIALNPSYEGFKKDIVGLTLPEYYKRMEELKLTKEQKANATYQPNGNIMSLGGSMTMSPISFLYDKYSRKSKMNRLYQEMMASEEEVDRVQNKYNREIVSRLTGLEGEELLNFMMYCHFSYYDIVRMSDEEIRSKIKTKFYDYQYAKMTNE